MNNPAAQTLGEAFSLTLTRLLNSMRVYNVLQIPNDYSIEDLKGRGYDNIIQAKVIVESDRGLYLKSRVLDAHSNQEMIYPKEVTYDYLAFFPVAEQMVNSYYLGLSKTRKSIDAKQKNRGSSPGFFVIKYYY